MRLLMIPKSIINTLLKTPKAHLISQKTILMIPSGKVLHFLMIGQLMVLFMWDILLKWEAEWEDYQVLVLRGIEIHLQ